jgi:D-amino-acid dehydrogenase
MHAVIVGGGIIGLSSAYYLQKAGYQVTIIDQTDFFTNCSQGNAGYICPSHFIPLATPGVVKQGLKWMFDTKSPFYIQPRLDTNLLTWAWHFVRSATAKKAAAAAIPLRDISLLSKQEYAQWAKQPDFDFLYQSNGLLEIFQQADTFAHAKQTLQRAHEIGLTDTRLISREELKQLEPQLEIAAQGALYFGCDAHCNPNLLIQQLLKNLKASGVRFMANSPVSGFEVKQKKIGAVRVGNDRIAADEVIMATGSWSREVLSKLDVKIPIMPGRGYSITLDNFSHGFKYPAILVEGRVAITPFSPSSIRFGGTMEITSHQTPPRKNRVEGIVQAVKRYYPNLSLTVPPIEKVWYGYRPCSADGLPYIGRVSAYTNLTVATGHAMLGLSLGAGTGKLVSEIITHSTLSMDISPFEVNRF